MDAHVTVMGAIRHGIAGRAWRYTIACSSALSPAQPGVVVRRATSGGGDGAPLQSIRKRLAHRSPPPGYTLPAAGIFTALAAPPQLKLRSAVARLSVRFGSVRLSLHPPSPSQETAAMAVLSLRLAGFAAAPYPRNPDGGGVAAFSACPCRVAAGRGLAGPITVSGDPPTVVSAPGRRIVALGDVHGDLHQTRAALQMAGLLSVESHRHVWTGGRTVLVQVGDILDRGEDEIAILSLLSSLNVQAKSQGGAVFQIIGNHETMNVEGDFRFVDPGAFDECIRFLEHLDECSGDWDHAFLNWVNVSERRKKQSGDSPNAGLRQWNFVEKALAARTSLFKRGGLLACELARHPVVLKVNDWIFCHGGVLPHHVEYGIERMNKEVSMWMKSSGEGSDDETDIPFIATRGYDSVVWSRLYSQDHAERTQRSVILSSIVAEQTLKTVGAKGMVVGHTPQMHGVNCKCDGKVWCVDVGMSYGVLYSKPEVLEIVNDRPRVLKKNRDGSYDEMEVLDYF